MTPHSESFQFWFLQRRRLVCAVTVACATATWANPPQTFSQGSLIIPMQSAYQTQCGTASAYGLVWKILYENRTGGAFGTNPITVYWAIQGTKSSPNRCVPSNLHIPPTAGSPSTWNDGCDFIISNPTQQPVVMVDYSLSPPTAPATYPVGAITHFETDESQAVPAYNDDPATAGKGQSPSLDALNDSNSPRFTTVRYMGGAFIVDASDAKRLVDAMRSGSYPHLNLHTSDEECAYLGSDNQQNKYRVMMHQATTNFIAPIYKRISNVPPKIALLDYGGGVKTVLQRYLDSAGLSGSIAGQPVMGTPTANSPSSGLVYDRLRAVDDLVSTPVYPKGYLNSKINGKSRYKVFWAPHWNVQNSSRVVDRPACTSDCFGDPSHDNKCSSNNVGNAGGSIACDATTGDIANALENIAFFADQRGNGLMAQCSSIGGYEAAREWDFNDSNWDIFSDSYSSTTHFQFTNQIEVNGLGGIYAAWSGKNCTDPDYTGGQCMRYLAADEAFAQMGDFAYNAQAGAINHFRPLYQSERRPGVRRMATSWEDWTVGSTAEGIPTSSSVPLQNINNGNDFFTLNQKDDDPEKATIVYVGGHDLSDSVSGTRIVLNTLLNLGSDPVDSYRSMTPPTAWVDVTNNNTPTILSSVFSVTTGTLLPGAMTFNKANGKNWSFPFTKGGIRARDADTGLSEGVNDLSDSVLWNSDGAMPRPAQRNLFTYFGGVVEQNPSLSGSRQVKNNVTQRGWVPERVEYSRINADFGSTPNASCVDVLVYGDYRDKYSGAQTAGLVRSTSGDGVCDLQQALQLTSFGWLTSNSNSPVTPPGLFQQLANDVPDAQQLIQLVRGYCFVSNASGPVLEPTDAQCTDFGSVGDNRAHMGGAVHSSAALVSPSAKIQDTGAPRPVVAYVGTWDGQLHAIYVGGGAGYTGPTGGRAYVDVSTGSNSALSLVNGPQARHPAETFKTNWAAQFASGSALPPRGTELWSYLPSTQLPLLRANAGRVDSSPVVQDVFVDMDGDGIRKWHTVLVVSLGGTSSEIFAMDVTNPLQPVLLWDIVGTNTSTLSFPSAARSDFDITGNAFPLEWDNGLTNYVLPPVSDPGRQFGFPFDYAELGGTRSVSIGQMREGLEPTYAAFVASNSSAQGGAPAKALLVYAIDIATGQKLWSWRQKYQTNSGSSNYRAADNTVPAGISVQNGVDGASTLYVGDMEGRLWELNASTGQSRTSLRDGTCINESCNFPAFDTRGTAVAPQPITTNVSIAKLPANVTGPLAPYANENILIMATAGANWVPISTGGQIHVALLDARRRKPVASGGSRLTGEPWSRSEARQSAASVVSGEWGGVLQEPNGLPYQLNAPDRVYGAITISGQAAFIPVVSPPPGGGVFDDPLSVSASLAGKTFQLNLGGLPSDVYTTSLPSFSLANFGGVAVFTLDRGGGTYQSVVIADEIGKTSKNAPAAGDATFRNQTRDLSTNESLPYRLYNAIRRFMSQQ
jgi:type IV pilus assembly protein PilY1